MKFVVLSSGSKGNTTYVECGDVKILIDVGNTCKYVVDKLKGIGVDAKDIDGILITHTHVDHVKGLRVFLNKYHTKVYCTEKIKMDLDYVDDYELIDGSCFEIGDIFVDVVRLSHDAPECLGYIIRYGGKSIVYVTDTGYINEKYFSILSNADGYIMESNHDIEMLQNGRYPFQLRQRIMGDKGHISNYDCARYLSNFLGDKTKCIVLAHLSEENNTPSLAYNTLMDRFKNDGKEVERVIVAKQDEETEVILV